MYNGGNLHDLEISRRFGEHLESMGTPTGSGNVAFGELEGLAMPLRCFVWSYILFHLFEAKDTDRFCWMKGNMTHDDIVEKDVQKDSLHQGHQRHAQDSRDLIDPDGRAG